MEIPTPRIVSWYELFVIQLNKIYISLGTSEVLYVKNRRLILCNTIITKFKRYFKSKI